MIQTGHGGTVLGQRPWCGLLSMGVRTAVRRSLRFLSTDEGGQSVVEFAMVVPLFMLIVLGIVVFGNLYRDHQTVIGATAAAARFEAICNGIPASNPATATSVGQAAGGSLSPLPTFTFQDLTLGKTASSTSNCQIPSGDQIKVTGSASEDVNTFIWNFHLSLSSTTTVTEQ